MDERIAGGPVDRAVDLGPFGRMVVREHGAAGPAVLVLHGIPGWRRTFDGVAARLGARHRVIAPDLLGFGDSDDAPPHFHAAEHADALVALLAKLAVDRVHLVGFDFGGPIAIQLGERLGTRATSVTVAATNLFPDTPIPPPLRVVTVPIVGALFSRIAFSTMGLMAMWRAAVGDRAAFPLARYRAALRGRGARTTRRIFTRSLRDLAGLYGDIERNARRLRRPSVVLWGSADPFFPVAVGERTASALGAELRVLDGCGHFVPEERPAEMSDAIAALVARSEARFAEATS